MTDTLDFRLLGDLEVSNEAERLPLGGGKLRVMLATLLLRANQTVSVDELVDRLWGVGAPAKARTTAQVYVMRLRQALGDHAKKPGLILTRPGGYLIKIRPDQLDLSTFRGLVEQASQLPPADAAERLCEALSLWRGPALADIPSESLRRDAIPRLAEERLQVLERRIELELELGRHSDLVGELAALTEQHPYRERFRFQLMLALFRAGRQAEALESFRDIRSRLDEELGLEPGSELQRLHELILRNDMHVQHVPQNSTSVSVPRQLPADAASFAGRDADLATLDSLIDAKAMTIAVIHGTAGVGKTALAVHWSHRVAGRFPDGQLYLNLRGFDPDRPPTDPGEALSQLLRALGVEPDQIPYDVEERAALYRSTIAGKRLLVVLDNAATVDQVRPLLPGTPPCLLLATSRNQLTGLVAVNGAHSMPLDVLDVREAMTLLENVVGPARVAAELDAATELVRLCGYLPLALRLAAGKLSVRPRHSIAAAVAELDEGCRLAALEVDGDSRAAVRPAFDLSYFALKPEDQELFRRLGQVAGPDFTVPAAAALIGSSTQDAARLLNRLVLVHLVESPVPGRYRLHDLLRLYARDVCAKSEHDPRASSRRLFDWYIATAEAAAETLYPRLRLLNTESRPPATFADSAEAWAWLEAELPNLAAAMDCAVSQDMLSVAWRVADAIRGFFLARTYHFDRWQATALMGLAAAEHAGDKKAEAAMHINLGTTRWGRCDYEGFLGHSSKAVALAREIEWTAGEIKALGNVGHAYVGLGRPERALEFTEQALDAGRRSDSQTGVIHNLRILAHTHAEIGNLREALDYFHEALAIAQQKAAVLDQTDALNGLGWVYWQLGELQNAESSFAASLAAAREQGARFRETQSLSRLAEIACETGRESEARELSEQALALARDAGRRHVEVDVLNAAGRIAVRLGQAQNAAQHHQRAFTIANEVKYPYGETDALIGLSSAHFHLADHDDALRAGERALSSAENVGYRVLRGNAFTVLAEIEMARGNQTKATSYVRQALELHQATGHKPGEMQAMRLLQG